MRTSLELYALSVCFTTLMCFMVALGIGLYDLVQMAAPEFTSTSSQSYKTNEQFLQYYPAQRELPADQITRLRIDAFEDTLNGEQRAARQSAVFVLIVIVIDALMFGVHWRIAQVGK